MLLEMGPVRRFPTSDSDTRDAFISPIVPKRLLLIRCNVCNEGMASRQDGIVCFLLIKCWKNSFDKTFVAAHCDPNLFISMVVILFILQRVSGM